MAVRKTKSEWLALFDEQDKSGLSVATFCRERNLSEPYFYLKRKKLKGCESSLSTFVKVQAPGTQSHGVVLLE